MRATCVLCRQRFAAKPGMIIAGESVCDLCLPKIEAERNARLSAGGGQWPEETVDDGDEEIGQAGE